MTLAKAGAVFWQREHTQAEGPPEICPHTRFSSGSPFFAFIFGFVVAAAALFSYLQKSSHFF